MTTPAARLLVLVGEQFACIKIVGRATFTSSIDFKTLTSQLLQKGYRYFVLELSECQFMDSTFLGAGRLQPEAPPPRRGRARC